jgi:hypothetical protein
MTDATGPERPDPATSPRDGGSQVLWALYLGLLAWAAYAWFGS